MPTPPDHPRLDGFRRLATKTVQTRGQCGVAGIAETRITAAALSPDASVVVRVVVIVTVVVVRVLVLFDLLADLVHVELAHL